MCIQMHLNARRRWVGRLISFADPPSGGAKNGQIRWKALRWERPVRRSSRLLNVCCFVALYESQLDTCLTVFLRRAWEDAIQLLTRTSNRGKRCIFFEGRLVSASSISDWAVKTWQPKDVIAHHPVRYASLANMMITMTLRNPAPAMLLNLYSYSTIALFTTSFHLIQ
jgi:hypothetical protein